VAQSYSTVIAPTYNYIESDFEDADETLRDYRARIGDARGTAFRRFRRRLMKTADELAR
jgi:hypothetical protein